MALLGVLGIAGLGTAGWALWQIRPRDPMFEVVNISISGFNLNWQRDGIVPYAVVDVSLTLYIKVVNPNVTPIQYTSTIMDIFYRGTQLGQATVRFSCLLQVPNLKFSSLCVWSEMIMCEGFHRCCSITIDVVVLSSRHKALYVPKPR